MILSEQQNHTQNQEFKPHSPASNRPVRELSRLAEFDFRYNQRFALGIDDQQRTDKLLRGVSGKRIYYRQPV